MANKSVVLYQSIKVGNKWILCPVDEDASHFPKGPFYVSWYDGRKKQMEPVGRDPEHALRMANRRRATLAFIAAGGEVKNSQLVRTPVPDSLALTEQNLNSIQNPARDLAGGKENRNDTDHNDSRERKSVETAVSEYLDDCRDRQGKSGYGIAPRTVQAYEYRLGFLVEFKPDAFMDEIDRGFMKAFRRFLRNHPKDLSDRTSYNVMQAVSTFLLRHDITAAKPILKEMSFPPTVVIPYSEEEMLKFFSACNETDEILFKFFLHSMARDMEVAHCEVRDLKFEINVLHICPKPDRDFRLKGKRSGQAKKGRKVPVPAAFMARMKTFCTGKGQRQLLFPNSVGKIETHFLRKCKAIARRAGIEKWEDFNLHRWRKTGATKHHEKGVSVRKIQAWLGHESLEVTLDYLGVDDAADEISQQQVNNGALAAFV